MVFSLSVMVMWETSPLDRELMDFRRGSLFCKSQVSHVSHANDEKQEKEATTSFILHPSKFASVHTILFVSILKGKCLTLLSLNYPIICTAAAKYSESHKTNHFIKSDEIPFCRNSCYLCSTFCCIRSRQHQCIQQGNRALQDQGSRI